MDRHEVAVGNNLRANLLKLLEFFFQLKLFRGFVEFGTRSFQVYRDFFFENQEIKTLSGIFSLFQVFWSI